MSRGPTNLQLPRNCGCTAGTSGLFFYLATLCLFSDSAFEKRITCRWSSCFSLGSKMANFCLYGKFMCIHGFPTRFKYVKLLIYPKKSIICTLSWISLSLRFKALRCGNFSRPPHSYKFSIRFELRSRCFRLGGRTQSTTFMKLCCKFRVCRFGRNTRPSIWVIWFWRDSNFITV